MLTSSPHELNAVTGLDGPLHDSEMDDDTAVAVVLAVEDECLQRLVRFAFWCRYAVSDRFEDLVDPDPGLGADEQCFVGVESEHGFDFGQHFVDPRHWQVDLVDDRYDFEPGFECGIGVGDGLSLDSLEGVDQQKGPFTGGQAPGNFVVKVDVAGGVDQVEFVVLAVEFVIQRDRACLDRDASVSFDVEIIEDLVAELAFANRTGPQQQLVGQRTLAVVDVCDDREVADSAGVHGGRHPSGRLGTGRDGR